MSISIRQAISQGAELAEGAEASDDDEDPRRPGSSQIGAEGPAEELARTGSQEAARGPVLVLNASIASPYGNSSRGTGTDVLPSAELSLAIIQRGILADRDAERARLRERHEGQGAERAELVRLQRWARQSAARKIIPEARVASCLRKRVKPFVELQYSQRVKRAHYAGLMTCASVWDCPVCSAKITERRRVDIESVAVLHPELTPFMLTLTMQHARGESLALLNAHIAEAFRRLKSGKGWELFAERWQIIASVAGKEITWGAVFGWHDHLHVLIWSRLSRSELDAEEIREAISSRYDAILKKRGRYANAEHGVDVRMADSLVADYIAKFGHEPKDSTWSLGAEITKGAAKMHLRADQHYTPFQLLDLYLLGDAASGAEAAKLFREYAIAMHRKNQLTWSRGGRAALGLDAIEPTDEELAGAGQEDAQLLAILDAEDWAIVLKGEHRGQLLEVASRGNYNELVIYMRALGAADFGKEVRRSSAGLADPGGT